ncbi:unnamed protein product [Calypogeia fissa]
MAATLCCALPTRVFIEGASASFSGRTTTTMSQRALPTQSRIIVPLRKLSVSLMSGNRHGGQGIVRCAASGGGVEGQSSSCCGGSGGGGEGAQSGGGKCSSHGLSKDDSTADMSGIGKEFEALVAQKTMQEFEAQYQTGQMQGTISRDVISDVVNIYPEAVSNKDNEEKFLDVEELLAEARAMSSKDGDFIFDADFEDMLV